MDFEKSRENRYLSKGPNPLLRKGPDPTIKKGPDPKNCKGPTIKTLGSIKSSALQITVTNANGTVLKETQNQPRKMQPPAQKDVVKKGQSTKITGADTIKSVKTMRDEVKPKASSGTSQIRIQQQSKTTNQGPNQISNQTSYSALGQNLASSPIRLTTTGRMPTKAPTEFSTISSSGASQIRTQQQTKTSNSRPNQVANRNSQSAHVENLESLYKPIKAPTEPLVSIQRRVMQLASDWENIKMKYTALHVAAVRNMVPEVESMILQGMSVDILDKNSCTPLHRAAYAGATDAIKTLLKFKSNIEAKDSFGWTPLLWAARGGQFQAINILLENKADPLAQDNNGFYATHYASKYSNAGNLCKNFFKGIDEELQPLILAPIVSCCESCSLAYSKLLH